MEGWPFHEMQMRHVKKKHFRKMILCELAIINCYTTFFFIRHCKSILLLNNKLLSTYPIWPKVCGPLSIEHSIPKPWALMLSCSSFAAIKNLQSSGKVLH